MYVILEMVINRLFCYLAVTSFIRSSTFLNTILPEPFVLKSVSVLQFFSFFRRYVTYSGFFRRILGQLSPKPSYDMRRAFFPFYVIIQISHNVVVFSKFCH